METKCAKESWMPETNCWLASGTLLPAKGNMKVYSDEHHEIFAHELHIAMMLTVGFWNTYFVL